MPYQSMNSGGGGAGSYYPGFNNPIQAWGQGTPLGPYEGMGIDPYSSQWPGAAGTPGGGHTTSTGSSGPTGAAESWLNGVLSGQNLPFNPTTTGAMLSAQSDMSSAAEVANNQALAATAAAGGASASDPSMAGAKAGNMQRRQTANQTAKRDIDTKASTANFGAQMDAAGQLQQSQLTREGWAQQNRGSMATLPFSPWSGGGGGGNNRSRNNSNFFTGFSSNYTSNPSDPYGGGIATGGNAYYSGGNKYAPGQPTQWNWNGSTNPYDENNES